MFWSRMCRWLVFKGLRLPRILLHKHWFYSNGVCRLEWTQFNSLVSMKCGSNFKRKHFSKSLHRIVSCEIAPRRMLQDFTNKIGSGNGLGHDDVIKWKHFPRHWPFVRGIHRSPISLMFSLICAWMNGWLNNREACVMRRHRAHYDVTVMR